MRRKLTKYAVPLLLVIMTIMLSGCDTSMMVLDPKGPVGADQRDLIVISTVLCLIVLVPVLVLAGWIVWRYRDKPDNKAAYMPVWSHNTKAEVIWWAIPIIIIGALAVVTVKYTYALEPSKPLKSDKEPLVIQATSLDWKWLFTYPEQGIATVNYIEIPEDRPIRFQLTSDAPMNSFWIPQLGGQMYTMSGMDMTLNLQADEPGVYFGSGANFSGPQFADMRFEVKATSDADFDTWVNEVKSKGSELTLEGYEKLAEPSSSDRQYFSSFPEGLHQKIVNKYVVGEGHHHGGNEESK
ncbi:ubiquinol oxidase subunit II [Paenibacillus sp. MMS18-CY102]|uniref:ubiquinol oxidase subunit II n=1 Tax=Paenibacillus sp. MMS18-CY102 TaxID=2682849 RepID=UPI001F0217A2|nr:ubiquinol oxidase subunit II [Paenibacillus sp. MMS18-CY102]